MKSKLGFKQLANTQLSIKEGSTINELYHTIRRLHSKPETLLTKRIKNGYRKRLKDFIVFVIQFNLDYNDYNLLLKIPHIDIEVSEPREGLMPEVKIHTVEEGEEADEYNYVNERLNEIDVELYKLYNQLSSELETLKTESDDGIEISKVEELYSTALPTRYQRYEGIISLTMNQMQLLITRFSHKYPELNSFQKKAAK